VYISTAGALDVILVNRRASGAILLSNLRHQKLVSLAKTCLTVSPNRRAAMMSVPSPLQSDPMVSSRLHRKVMSMSMSGVSTGDRLESGVMD